MNREFLDHWIGLHLDDFLIGLEKGFDKCNPIEWKCTSEVGFILLFFKEYPEWANVYLENVKIYLDDKKEIVEVSEKTTILIWNRLLNKDLKSINLNTEEIDFLDYRGQLELIAYCNFDKNLFQIEEILGKRFIAQKLSADNFDILDIYELTHEIMYLTNFRKRELSGLERLNYSEKDYLKQVIIKLLKKMIVIGNADVTGELLICILLLELTVDQAVLSEARNLLENFIESVVNQSNIENVDFYDYYHEFLVIRLMEELDNEGNLIPELYE